MKPPRPLGQFPPLAAAKLDAVVLSLTNDSQFVALLRLNQSVSNGHALELVADISARLRAACGHLDDDAYAALVLSLAQTRIRFHLQDHERLQDQERARGIAPAGDGVTVQPQNGEYDPSSPELP